MSKTKLRWVEPPKDFPIVDEVIVGDVFIDGTVSFHPSVFFMEKLTYGGTPPRGAFVQMQDGRWRRWPEAAFAAFGLHADAIAKTVDEDLNFIIFRSGNRLAMLECGLDGSVSALLRDRSTNAEGETWVVTPDALEGTVRRIKNFLDPSPTGPKPSE